MRILLFLAFPLLLVPLSPLRTLSILLGNSVTGLFPPTVFPLNTFPFFLIFSLRGALRQMLPEIGLNFPSSFFGLRLFFLYARLDPGLSRQLSEQDDRACIFSF